MKGLQPMHKRERTPAVVRSSSLGPKDAKQGKKPRIPESYAFIQCRKPNCPFGVSPYQNCNGHYCKKCSETRRQSHGEFCLKIEEHECVGVPRIASDTSEAPTLCITDKDSSAL